MLTLLHAVVTSVPVLYVCVCRPAVRPTKARRSLSFVSRMEVLVTSTVDQVRPMHQKSSDTEESFEETLVTAQPCCKKD